MKQYRFAVQGRILEFPAGTVEVNEIQETIRREIEEETGYQASQWRKLGSLSSLRVTRMKSFMPISLKAREVGTSSGTG